MHVGAADLRTACQRDPGYVVQYPIEPNETDDASNRMIDEMENPS